MFLCIVWNLEAWQKGEGQPFLGERKECGWWGWVDLALVLKAFVLSLSFLICKMRRMK